MVSLYICLFSSVGTAIYTRTIEFDTWNTWKKVEKKDADISYPFWIHRCDMWTDRPELHGSVGNAEFACTYCAKNLKHELLDRNALGGICNYSNASVFQCWVVLLVHATTSNSHFPFWYMRRYIPFVKRRSWCCYNHREELSAKGDQYRFSGKS